MVLLKNRVGVSTSTVGAGLPVALGAPLPVDSSPNFTGWKTFAQAGVQHGDAVRYLVLDANGAWEYGLGTYQDTPVGPITHTQVGAPHDSGVFKDWLKQSLGLRSVPGYDFPPLLNANQYPLPGANITQGIYRDVQIPPFHVWGSTQLVLRWTGTMNGTIAGVGGFLQIQFGVEPDAVATSGNILLAGASNLFVYGTDGRVVFRLKDPLPAQPRPISVAFSFYPGDSTAVFSVSKVMLCRLSDEAAAWANATPESIITDEYKALYTELGISTFRPMGMSGTNSGRVSQERYGHKWDTGIGFTCGIWQPGAWVGPISGINTYTCGPGTDYPTGPYVQGEVIQGRVTNTSTDLCTLNVLRPGSSGAKPIVDTRGQRMSQSTPNVEAPLPGGLLNTFVYDRIIDSWIAHSQDNFADGQGAGIDSLSRPPWPLAMRVGLCNACGMNYWHNFDMHLDDASVTQQVTYIRQNLAAGKTCTLEYSNELWNFFFAQFHMGGAMGRALGFAAGDGGAEGPRRYGWQGLRSRQMFDLAIAAWAPRDPAELIPYFGLQIAASDPASEPVRFALLGENLTTVGNAAYSAKIGVNYNVAPNRPVDRGRAVGAAPYFGGTMVLQFSAHYKDSFDSGFPSTILAGKADDYASGNPVLMDAALQWVDRDIRGNEPGGWPVWSDFTLRGYRTGILQGNDIGVPGLGYPGMKALANSFGLLCRPYEGGWSLDPPSPEVGAMIGLAASYCGPTGKIAKLIDAWRMSEYAHLTCKAYHDEQMAAGWTEPSWLQLSGGETGNQFGVWKFDPLGSGPRQKAWEAIDELNSIPVGP